MPKRITARDEQTGRTVTFDWHLDTPPTDEDMAEVFAQAAPPKAAPPAKREFAPPDDPVRPGSPQDRLEKASTAVFGDYAPTVNRAVGAAANMTAGFPGVSGLGFTAQMLRDGASAGGTVGGLAGGLLGGLPGAAAGAGLLGAGAGGLQRWFRGQPSTAKDATIDAVTQGAGELIAPGIARGVKAVAYPIYKAALRPGSLISQRFGDVTRRSLDEGLIVTGKQAIPQSEALTTASHNKVLGMVDEIDPNDLIRPSEIAPAFDEAISKAKVRQKQLGFRGELEAVLDRKRRVLEGMGGKAAVPPTPPTPPGLPTVMRVQSKQAPLAMSGDQALALQEFQLGHQADLAPGRVFQPTEPEVRAARQLGPSTAGVIPSRILNGPAPPPKPPIEFVSPGKPGLPGKPGKPAVRGGETPRETYAGKRASQQEAADLFDRKAAGDRVSEVEDAAELGLEQMRREALERRSPNMQAENRNTQELMGVTRALKQADIRHVGGVGSGNIVPDLIAGAGGMFAAGPVGAGAGIGLGRILRSIGAAAPMSGIAIGLDRTGNVGIKHADKLTAAVRALAIKLKADREAEDDRRRAEYEKKKAKKEHP